MNHRTEAEAFRAALDEMSRPQLHEAMQYLRACDPRAMARALEFAAMNVAGTPVAARDSGVK